jgi:hypothetical protein
MGLLPPVFHVGKRCLVYCGDARCNCDCNPRYRSLYRTPIQPSNDMGSTSKSKDDSIPNIVEDAEQ